MFKTFIFTVLFSSTSWSAIDSYLQRVDEVYLPFYLASEKSFFTGVNDRKIHYRSFQQTNDQKKSVIFLSGFTEPTIKYAELIHQLHTSGYSVFTMDHRGHGWSDRLSDVETLTHVENFEYYSGSRAN